MLYWAVLISVCIAVTIVGTLLTKRPMQIAVGVSLFAGIVIGLYGARSSALWMLGSVMVIVCSLPATIITGILVENLMDKWSANSRE